MLKNLFKKILVFLLLSGCASYSDSEKSLFYFTGKMPSTYALRELKISPAFLYESQKPYLRKLLLALARENKLPISEQNATACMDVIISENAYEKEIYKYISYMVEVSVYEKEKLAAQIIVTGDSPYSFENKQLFYEVFNRIFQKLAENSFSKSVKGESA